VEKELETIASKVCHSLEQRGHGGDFTAAVPAGVEGDRGVPALESVRE